MKNMTLEQFNKHCLDNNPDNDELAKIFRNDDCDAGQVIFYLEDRWDDADILNFINEYEFIFSDEIYSDTVADFYCRIIDKSIIGKRIKFRSPTRYSDACATRVVRNVFFNDEGNVSYILVSYQGWTDFYVRPCEIIEIED